MAIRMNEINQNLLRKDGYVAVQIARDLLGRRPGDRLPRVQDYAKAFQTGHGTIQNALRLLVEAQALTLEPRGHLGTFLGMVNYRRLWELGGHAYVLGLMPLPYSRRYEGLATGLYEAFRRADMPFNLAYIRGATNRLQALERGQGDFAVLSRLSAETAMEESGIAITARFGPKSYVGEHALILRKGLPDSLTDGMRVGVDPCSMDQYHLTTRLCAGKKVELVEIRYTQVLEMLEHGRVDAVVWNADEVARSGKVKMVPLELGADPSNTEAVLVTLKGRPDMERVLANVIKPPDVLEAQRQVMAGERIPSY